MHLCDYHSRTWRDIAAACDSTAHFMRRMARISHDCGDCRALKLLADLRESSTLVTIDPEAE